MAIIESKVLVRIQIDVNAIISLVKFISAAIINEPSIEILLLLIINFLNLRNEMTLIVIRTPSGIIVSKSSRISE